MPVCTMYSERWVEMRPLDSGTLVFIHSEHPLLAALRHLLLVGVGDDRGSFPPASIAGPKIFVS